MSKQTKRTYLTDAQAIFLGKELNTKVGTRKKAQYSLNKEDQEKLKCFSGIVRNAADLGLNETEIKHGWLKNDESSLFFKNPLYTEKEENKLFENLEKYLSEKAPSYPNILRRPLKESHLLVLNPADIHIGKLASSFEGSGDYNSNLAVQRVHEGVEGILDRSSGFRLDQILFVGGNDILHIDNPKRQTTSGTPQDTDGMWYENFVHAFRLYTEILERLTSVANVHFSFCPSNHDFMSGFHLCFGVAQFFKKNKNISFDVDMSHRKYMKYGKNLIGNSHGDGAKMQDLPLLMAEEAKHYWADVIHKYWYTYHVHHKSSKDFMSVNVETMRSPSEADSWHHRNGYEHSPKAVEGFLHHKEHGQIARFSHIF